MNFSLKKLQIYCEKYSSPVSDILYELERETNLKTLAPQMISGPLQGQLLTFISHMIDPKQILEIGTFTGYAAICLAQGLQQGGILHTIEANRELEYIIRKYVSKAGLDEKIKLYIGKAQEVIPKLKEQFDLVFIDAGKRDYAFFFDLVLERVRPGGFILADNVLWNGKVVSKEHDNDTKAMHVFNEKIQKDLRVENLILPIRDGLLIMRKLDI